MYMYITCILMLEILLCASSKVKGQKSTRGGESRNEAKVQQLFVPTTMDSNSPVHAFHMRAL